MTNIKLGLIIIGAVLAFVGYEEFVLSSIAKQEPTTVDMYELETSTSVDNAHIKITEHDAIYGGMVYSYKQKKGDTGEPTGSSLVSETYYAVLSTQHSFIESLEALWVQYPDGIPDEVEYPELNNIRAIIKTKRFETVDELPEASIQRESELQGIVINEIESLGTSELNLLQESFPGVDLDRVLLIEEGRKPSSSTNAMGMMGGGVLMSLVGLYWLVAGAKKKRMLKQNAKADL